MSHVRRLIWSTRERLLSNDLNDSVTLIHRGLIEVASAIAAPGTARSGVIRGLEVAIVGGTLTCQVAAGVALRVGTPSGPYESAVQYIELRAPQVVDLSSFVDGANPRWLALEISEADAVEVASLRDQFVSSTGTFQSISMDKVRGSSPLISIAAGTPAATPQLPAGTVGRLPLAYIFVPAAAATLNAGDIVHCRALLAAPGSIDSYAHASNRRVSGGGVSVASTGTTLSLRGCVGHFDGHALPFGVGVVGSTTSFALSAAACDGGSLPVADGPLYIYALPPPFPSGYQADLAPREFRLGSNAATRFPAFVTPELSGGIVVASTKAPNAGTMQGAPTSGTFSIGAAPWGGSATIDASRAVYLGAVSFDAGPNNVKRQDEVAGLVIPRDGNPITSLVSGGAFIATPAQVNLRGTGTQTFFMPNTAAELLAHLAIANGDAWTTLAAELRDETWQGGPSTGAMRWAWAGTVPTAMQHRFTALTNINGEITLQSVSASAAPAASGVSLLSAAYRDAVLTRR